MLLLLDTSVSLLFLQMKLMNEMQLQNTVKKEKNSLFKLDNCEVTEGFVHPNLEDSLGVI